MDEAYADNAWFIHQYRQKGNWKIPAQAIITHDCIFYPKLIISVPNDAVWNDEFRSIIQQIGAKIVRRLQNIRNYVDEIVCHTEEWMKHMQTTHDVFTSILHQIFRHRLYRTREVCLGSTA